MDWYVTSTFPLHGSPSGRECLFLGTAHGSSFSLLIISSVTMALLSTLLMHRPGGNWHGLGGNWHRWVNDHVISCPFLHLCHIPCLLLNSTTDFTAILMGWIHLAYSQLKVHVKCCTCVSFLSLLANVRIGLMPHYNSFNRSYIILVYICCVNLI